MGTSGSTSGGAPPDARVPGLSGSGSFTLRLVAMCLAPILGFVWLGSLRLDELERSVDEAELVLRSAEMHRNVNGVVQAAEGERLTLSALALADRIGIRHELLGAIGDLDLAVVYQTVAARLDGELDQLGHRLASTPTADAAALRDRLAETRAELVAHRSLSVDMEADPDDLSATFDAIDAIATASLDADGYGSADGSVVTPVEHQFDQLLAVIMSGNVYATTMLDSLTENGDPTALDIAVAVHDTHLEALEGIVPSDARVDVRQLRREFARASREIAGMVGSITVDASVEPLEIIAAMGPLIAAFEYLADLEAFADLFQNRVVADADRFAGAVRSDALSTRLVMVGASAVTLVLIALVAVSTILPLRRLGRRAQLIVDGELALEPLPVRGPGIVRQLTATVNAMLLTLHGVDRQIAVLASGDTSPTPIDIPGRIGQTLRESVDRLARVTAQWQTSERRASSIVGQAADAIWAVDVDGIIHTSNAASERLLQVPTADQVGRPLTDFLPTLDGETVVNCRPGLRVHVVRSRETDSNEMRTVIARDLTERFRFEERLAHQARHDVLTELPNRFAVLERLQQLHDERESVAVLFIDIDGFKSVNDTHGHAAGDRVLAEIGRRLACATRPTDYVARLGGDEFVVLTGEVVDIADVEPFGRRIIQEIELPYHLDDTIFTLSASVGVALMDQTVPPLESVRRADNAVYVAKRHGRGRVEAFDAKLQATIEHDAELELALRNAIRSDELVLHYQPIIDLGADTIAGVEALVRWERPSHGMLPPNEFIPIAERSSLIVDLERWVLQEACATLARWRERDRSFDATMAINISGRHLVDGNLVRDLDEALESTGADPSLIVFELTETQLLEDVDRAIEVLDEIRRRGITISVDDFGTGYSSMTYLRDLPVDAIKIDRTFMANALADGNDEPLVDAILALGKSLDIKVVAEGVETELQLEYIASRGCDFAQGFLFARPLPGDEAEALLFGTRTPAQLSPAR